MKTDGGVLTSLCLAAVLSMAAGAAVLAPITDNSRLVDEDPLPVLGITGSQPDSEASAGPANLIRPTCKVSNKLVPTCGRWWGVAPGALTSTPRHEALLTFEEKIGRPVDIYHSYHRDGELFPTAEERDIAQGRDGRRLLLINWKPSTEVTWRAVAEGAVNDRIDALAAHIRTTFADRFFLTVWHEPENDVNSTSDSGMTASDYAAMYRHVVSRLRDRNVDNAVTVMSYMGYPAWGATPWFSSLYPGDDVVDWIAADPYLYASPRTTGQLNSFRDLVDRPGDSWPGFYTWAQNEHPTKPIMISEWGVFASSNEPWRKSHLYRSVARQIEAFPGIKALVYFDSPNAPKGDTRIDSDDVSAEAYRDLGWNPALIGPVLP